MTLKWRRKFVLYPQYDPIRDYNAKSATHDGRRYHIQGRLLDTPEGSSCTLSLTENGVSLPSEDRYRAHTLDDAKAKAEDWEGLETRLCDIDNVPYQACKLVYPEES